MCMSPNASHRYDRDPWYMTSTIHCATQYATATLAAKTAKAAQAPETVAAV